MWCEMPGIQLKRLAVIIASWRFNWELGVPIEYALDEMLTSAQLYEHDTERKVKRLSGAELQNRTACKNKEVKKNQTHQTSFFKKVKTENVHG